MTHIHKSTNDLFECKQCEHMFTSDKRYKAKLKHDKGTHYITINANSEEQAISAIMDIELCPRSAIINIKEVK